MLDLCGEKGITCDVEVRWQRCVSVLVAPSVCHWWVHCRNTGMHVLAPIPSILMWSFGLSENCLRYILCPVVASECLASCL